MRAKLVWAALAAYLLTADAAWAPDLPPVPITTNCTEPLSLIACVTPTGGASGGPVLHLRNGDIQHARNVQLGYCDDKGCDPNGDLGAGGDGAPGRGPRGRLSIQYDVGLDTIVWDGEKGPLLYLSKRRSVLYSDHRPMIKLQGGRIYLYKKPVIVHR